MNKHTINPEADFTDFESSIRLAGAHGPGFNKSLDAVVFFDETGLNTYLKVCSDKKIVITTRDFSDAIRTYNEI